MSMPTGTITFLFTDIEGSTTLWEKEPVQMKEALKLHDDLMRQCIESRNGYVFKTMGDAFLAAFSRTADAVDAAVECQSVLESQDWKTSRAIRVRMAIHTGTAEVRDGDYFGQSLNRIARVLSTCHGGQLIITIASMELVRDQLSEELEITDLGEHRLKDLVRAEKLFQINLKGRRKDFPPLRSLNAAPHNLPVQTTSFIGRQKEVAAVLEKFFPPTGEQGARLVTLLSAGGAGKTRLSQQCGAELMDRFPDGIWFVDLASVREDNAAVALTARVLGIELREDTPSLERLNAGVKNRKLMVILDNCEHLISIAAEIAQQLLHSNADIRVLATSREFLRIGSEEIFIVPPLEVPEHDTEKNFEELNQYDSVKLFIERTRTVNPEFVLDKESAAAIADICYHLDGMPLAIELAAAKMRILDVHEIRERMTDRFKLLTQGSRTALPRQQTMRALIDWSYVLLDDEEKDFFCRLSVFNGSFDLKAAEYICGENSDIVDLMDKLCMKSIVFREEKNRFRFLETIREYANEKALEKNINLLARHFEYYYRLAEKNADVVYGRNLWDRNNLLATEHENFNYALQWSLAESPLKGLEMCLNLSSYWLSRCFTQEGTVWVSVLMEKALAEQNARIDPLHVARAKLVLANFEHQKNHEAEANQFGKESLAIFEQKNDLAKMADAHRIIALSTYSFFMGGENSDTDDFYGNEMQKEFRTTLELYKKLDNQWGIAEAIAGLSMYEGWYRNNFEEAIKLAKESREIRNTIGDFSGLGWSDLTIAEFLAEKGETAEALSCFEDAKAAFDKANDNWGQTYLFEALGLAYIFEGRYDEAENLLVECERIRRRITDLGSANFPRIYLGLLKIEKKDWDGAESILMNAIEIAERYNSTFGISYASGILVRMYSIREKHPELLKILEKLKATKNLSGFEFNKIFYATCLVSILILEKRHTDAAVLLGAISVRFAKRIAASYSLLTKEYNRLCDTVLRYMPQDDFRKSFTTGTSEKYKSLIGMIQPGNPQR